MQTKLPSSEQRLTTTTAAIPERIIELNPAKIEGAFIADCLSEAGLSEETFDTLVTSIRQSGQQVPVLVRPHPDAAKRAAEWFQAAYGHRRIHATRTLGISIKALVRDLSDEDLVLAQGKENSERRILSFIERAFFARGLMKRGFDRAVAARARARPRTHVIKDQKGKIIARLTPSKKFPNLRLNEKSHPGLAAHVALALPRLVAEWFENPAFGSLETGKR